MTEDRSQGAAERVAASSEHSARPLIEKVCFHVSERVERGDEEEQFCLQTDSSVKV